MVAVRVLLCLGLCLTLHGCGADSAPMSYAEFARPVDAQAATHTFAGRLVYTGSSDVNVRVGVDMLDLMNHPLPGVRELPPFDMAFIQDDERLLPVEAGPVANDHDWWEWVFAPGYVWNEAGNSKLSQAAIPFALKEKNEDCLHNGVMRFAFKDSGKISVVHFQIAAQTCSYLQFEMWGVFDAAYVQEEIPGRDAVIAAFRQEHSTRLEAQPIDALTERFSEANPTVFGPPSGTAVGADTLYGYIIDGTHYQGGCQTAHGDYPFCDEMALPSYSTAKSLVGGLALMRAEFLQSGAAGSYIADYVPECGASWDDVTIEHALDMTTGHYDSDEVMADENALFGGPFFLGLTHADKIRESCTLYPRREAPGTTWVYQTPAIYLAGAAISRWLKEREGPAADMYQDLIVTPLWNPLSLGRSIHNTRRTLDDEAQPFSGYGLTFYRNDVAKIAQFLGADDGRIDGEDVLDRAYFDAVKGRITEDMGLVADYETMRYNNGFRIRDVSAAIGCDDPVWITNLSGHGGINIILMPNDTAFYRFGDDGVHRYIEAVIESHRIRPMCR
jgi:hypothetical protein